MLAQLTKHSRCILCASTRISSYLSLGTMAPANNFVLPKNLNKSEKRYPLGLMYCRVCHNSQLTHTVSPTTLFKDYAYFSSTSPLLVSHFKEYAQTLNNLFPKLVKQLVVDIGSNDGILLKPLQHLGARVLGVDPAIECSNLAIQFGIPTLQEYFTPMLAEKIQKQFGHAAIISANNVLAHTPHIHEFIQGVQILLQKDGIFVFEVKYMGDILTHNEFDIIYHEHVFSYLLHPLVALLNKHKLRIIDVQQMLIHGGSLRIFATHAQSSTPIQPSVQKLLNEEISKGYTKLSTYKKFAKKPPQVRKALRALLLGLIKNGKRIAGYGASAKGTTMLQYCKLNTKVIEYVVDSATSKIGTFTPITHIPVVDPKTLTTRTPDYILLLAWDHKDSITKKETWFSKAGGIYILPIPFPTLVKNPKTA